MTEREQEIFRIIQQNPAISQGELAAQLGITRSSVAVHITNLQKKGYILGKGYIVNNTPYVVGVGGANADICGRSKNPIVMRDSNPGHMSSSAGGVTRNVCENLARLGADVKLISAVGSDVYAEQIRRECLAAGIDIANLYTVDGHPSSTYLSILDDAGDMLVAMSDMSILQALPADYLTSKRGLIRGARLVTCDPCLPEPLIVHLLDECEGGPAVYVDPVSTAYARVLAPHIGRFDTAKPNVLELEILSGRKILSHDDLLLACEDVLRKGLRRIFVSLGKDGCLYMDRSGLTIERKLRPLEKMVNATGAGDAFMAAVIYGSITELPIETTIDHALAAGIAAVASEKNINPDMSVSLIESILKEYTV